MMSSPSTPAELVSAFRVAAIDGDRPGAYASFPYDRALVQRFRAAFPRARWRAEGCWFVPGTTAARRVDAWMAQELAMLDRYADDKGRDAYLFEPLISDYLTVADDLVVRTPYSRTVVEQMRAIPWARWDPEGRVWRLPFRSYDELRRRWPEIEAAARRNGPEERRRKPPLELDPAAKRLQAERRCRRYPVPGDDLPPIGEPLATAFGVVVFEAIEDEPVDREAAKAFAHVGDRPDRHVWARWRLPTFRELRAVKPTPAANDREASERGWWLPDREAVDARLQQLRRSERARRTRQPEQRSSAD